MTFIPAKASAWFEIPVTDMDRARAFYAAVLQNDLTLEESGPNPIAMFSAQERLASGHVYPGKPAAPGTGPTIHLMVAAPIEDAMARVTESGGRSCRRRSLFQPAHSPIASIPTATALAFLCS